MRINLLENGLHSLAKGLEDYRSFQTTFNKFILKDSILRIHHGIELCLKFILFKMNSAWILDNDIKLRKIIEAESKSKREGISFLEATDSLGMRNLTLIDSFKRIEALCPTLLTGDTMTFLRENIIEFVKFRNILQHHEANLSVDEVHLRLGSVIPLLFLIMKQQVFRFENKLNGHSKNATKIVNKLERDYGSLFQQTLIWLDKQSSFKIKLGLEFEHKIRSKRLKSYALKLEEGFIGKDDAIIMSMSGDSGLPESLASLENPQEDIDLRFKFDYAKLRLEKAPVFARKIKAQNLNINVLLEGPKWENVSEDHADYIDNYEEIWMLENEGGEVLTYSGQPNLRGEGLIELVGASKKRIKPRLATFRSSLNLGELIITRIPVEGGTFGYSYSIKIKTLCNLRIENHKNKISKS